VQLRKRRGWSLHAAAAATGIQAITIGSYERGDRAIRVSRANEILATYGYTFAVVPLGADVEHPLRDPGDTAWIREVLDELKAQLKAGQTQEQE
jgi:transcriptional regulator with XRE-family HTH domain